MAESTCIRPDSSCDSDGTYRAACHSGEDELCHVSLAHTESLWLSRSNQPQTGRRQEISSHVDIVPAIEHRCSDSASVDAVEEQYGTQHFENQSFSNEKTGKNSFHEAPGFSCHENPNLAGFTDNGDGCNTSQGDTDLTESPITTHHIHSSCPEFRDQIDGDALTDKEKSFIVFLDDMRCLTTEDDNHGVFETPLNNMNWQCLADATRVLGTIPSSCPVLGKKEGGFLSDKQQSRLVFVDDMRWLAMKDNAMVNGERPVQSIHTARLPETSAQAGACERMASHCHLASLNSSHGVQDSRTQNPRRQRRSGGDEEIIPSTETAHDAKRAVTSTGDLPEKLEELSNGTILPNLSGDFAKQTEHSMNDDCDELQEPEAEMTHSDCDGTVVFSNSTLHPVFKQGIQHDKRHSEPDDIITKTQSSGCGISVLDEKTEEAVTPDGKKYLAGIARQVTKASISSNHTPGDFRHWTVAKEKSSVCLLMARGCQNRTEDQIHNQDEQSSNEITVFPAKDSKIHSMLTDGKTAHAGKEDNAVVEDEYMLASKELHSSEHSELCRLDRDQAAVVGVSAGVRTISYSPTEQNHADPCRKTQEEASVGKLGTSFERTKRALYLPETGKLGNSTLDKSNVLRCNQTKNDITDYTPAASHKTQTERTVDLTGADVITQKEFCLKRKAEWGLQLSLEYTNSERLCTNHTRDTERVSKCGSTSSVPEELPFKQLGNTSSVPQELPFEKIGNASSVPQELPFKQIGNTSSVSQELPIKQIGNTSSVPQELPFKQIGNTSSVPQELPFKQIGNTSSVPQELPIKQIGNTSSVPQELPFKQIGNTSSVPQELPIKQTGNTSSVPQELPVKLIGNTSSEPQELLIKQIGNTSSVSQELPIKQIENTSSVPQELPIKQRGNTSSVPQELPIKQRTSTLTEHIGSPRVQQVPRLTDSMNEIDASHALHASLLSVEPPVSQDLHWAESDQLPAVYNKLVDKVVNGADGLPEQHVPDVQCLLPDNLRDVPEADLQHASFYDVEEKHAEEDREWPAANFKWKYRPSCEDDKDHEVPPLADDCIVTHIQPLNTGLCNRSLRLGLSRRQKVKRLHKL